MVLNLDFVADKGEGYYRYPAIHENIVVFTSEGDLWAVSYQDGMAMRHASWVANKIFNLS